MVDRSRDPMSSTYLDLAERSMKKWFEVSTSGKQQIWIGIAGGPGSGKSTLAEAVCHIINQQFNQKENNEEACVVIPMDGFHYSRQQLKEISERSGGETTFEELIARRGSPWTFDVKSLVGALIRAKAEGCGWLPVYSRQLSDPVPDGVQLKSAHKIVLVEGNYLLDRNDPAWHPLGDLFEDKWFIHCTTIEQQRQRLITRHLETWTPEKTRMWGEGALGAACKADANDVLNAMYVEQGSRAYADLCVESVDVITI